MSWVTITLRLHKKDSHPTGSLGVVPIYGQTWPFYMGGTLINLWSYMSSTGFKMVMTVAPQSVKSQPSYGHRVSDGDMDASGENHLSHAAMISVNELRLISIKSF
jgi:hypothetical protein